jgi:hypothetical protein
MVTVSPYTHTFNGSLDTTSVIVVFVGMATVIAPTSEGQAAHKSQTIAKKPIFLTFPDFHAEFVTFSSSCRGLSRRSFPQAQSRRKNWHREDGVLDTARDRSRERRGACRSEVMAQTIEVIGFTMQRPVV